jgi:hypothetical protein
LGKDIGGRAAKTLVNDKIRYPMADQISARRGVEGVFYVDLDTEANDLVLQFFEADLDYVSTESEMVIA